MKKALGRSFRAEYRHLNWAELIWDQRELDAKAKLVAMYLARCMNADHHVAWPSLETIADKTSSSRSSVVRAVNDLCDKGWLRKEPGGPLKGSTRYFPVFPKDIEQGLAVLSDAVNSIREGVTLTSGSVTQTLGSVTQTLGSVTVTPESGNESGKRSKVGSRFAPPTAKEVREYAKEMGYVGFSAERFCDFYESKGWVVGRVPMKSWKAAVRNWHRGNAVQQLNPKGKQDSIREVVL